MTLAFYMCNMGTLSFTDDIFGVYFNDAGCQSRKITFVKVG